MESVHLRGGETKEMKYDWKPMLDGQDVIRLVVEEEKKSHNELLWKISVLRGDTAAASPERMTPDQNIPETITTYTAENGAASSEQSASVECAVPVIEGLKAEVKNPWFGNARVILRWNAKTDGTERILIQEPLLVHKGPSGPVDKQLRPEESSSMRLELHDLHSKWIRSHGEDQKSVISDLSHGTHQIFVSILAKDDKILAQSQISVFVPAQRTWWDNLKVPLGAGAVALLILFLRRIRRGD
jgi:hypothetical protein